MRYWICREDGDTFILPAKTEAAAREAAIIYNATVVREATADEVAAAKREAK